MDPNTAAILHEFSQALVKNRAMERSTSQKQDLEAASQWAVTRLMAEWNLTMGAAIRALAVLDKRVAVEVCLCIRRDVALIETDGAKH